MIQVCFVTLTVRAISIHCALYPLKALLHMLGYVRMYMCTRVCERSLTDTRHTSFANADGPKTIQETFSQDSQDNET